MKSILINCLHIGAESSGVKVRLLNLYYNLSKKNNFKIYFLLSPETKFNFKINKNIKIFRSKYFFKNFFLRYFQSKFLLNYCLKKYNFDYYDHSFLPIVHFKFAKTLFTIHDLRYLNKGLYKNIFTNLLFQFLIKKAFKYSYKVITVSRYMQNEILHHFKQKTEVICNFLNPTFYVKKKINQKRKNFIFSVGHIENRKNIFFLVNAYKKLIENKIFNGKLIIATSQGKLLPLLKKKIINEKLQNKVIIKNHPNNAQLINYYDTCLLFVFPSLYEGFGIPLLEALSRNTPILSSDLKVFKEILGNDNIFFNPKNYKSFEISFKKILKHKVKKKNKILKKYSINQITSDFNNKILT